MVRMDQRRLHKKDFGRIREYKRVGGYEKQMREYTKKLKTAWIENNTERNQYSCVSKIKNKWKGTAWSKERKQRYAELMRRYWDKRKAKMRKENY